LSEEKKSRKKDWVHIITFNAYFEDALAKYRARTGYGVTFALYNSLNEFWHESGDMTDEGYVYNKQKYSETLIEAKRRKEKEPTLQLKQDPEIIKTQKTFVMVIDQWEIHKNPEWRQHWIEEAEQLKDTIPEARELLRKAGIPLE